MSAVGTICFVPLINLLMFCFSLKRWKLEPDAQIGADHRHLLDVMVKMLLHGCSVNRLISNVQKLRKINNLRNCLAV